MLWDTQLSEVKLLIKSVENCTKYFWSKPAWLYSRNINYPLQYLYKYMCTSAHSKHTDRIWWFFIWTIAMSWHLAYIWCASWTFNGHLPNMIQHQSKMYIQITADFSSQLRTNLMASETNLKFLCPETDHEMCQITSATVNNSDCVQCVMCFISKGKNDSIDRRNWLNRLLCVYSCR